VASGYKFKLDNEVRCFKKEESPMDYSRSLDWANPDGTRECSLGLKIRNNRILARATFAAALLLAIDLGAQQVVKAWAAARGAIEKAVRRSAG
jgi:hypothetical protein